MSAILPPPGAGLMHDAIRLRNALGLSNRDARSEVELLLMRVLRVTRAQLIAHPELALQAESNEDYCARLERRLNGEPIAYILGEREFYGSVFTVTNAVLIPRPETELLVDMALERLDPADKGRVLDLGTGSGVIGVAIAQHRPHMEITAVDASAGALAVAAANCRRLLGDQNRMTLIESDWFGQLDGAVFDLIVSNPPYVANDDAHLATGDLRFEPLQALRAGRDGLDALRRIIGTAPQYLSQGGWLLCEHGYDQAYACRELLQQAGFTDLVAERDLSGIPRVCGGRWLTRAGGSR